MQIDFKKQLQYQGILLLAAFLAHTVLIKSGIGEYSVEDAQWYHVADMTLMISTTVGMSEMVPRNLPSMAVSWIHTVLIFVVLGL
nr:hypothetical protein TetV2_00523 [Oceanusvirus sp.]